MLLSPGLSVTAMNELPAMIDRLRLSDHHRHVHQLTETEPTVACFTLVGVHVTPSRTGSEVLGKETSQLGDAFWRRERPEEWTTCCRGMSISATRIRSKCLLAA
jgi:hypothetical protein